MLLGTAIPGKFRAKPPVLLLQLCTNDQFAQMIDYACLHTQLYLFTRGLFKTGVMLKGLGPHTGSKIIWEAPDPVF